MSFDETWLASYEARMQALRVPAPRRCAPGVPWQPTGLPTGGPPTSNGDPADTSKAGPVRRSGHSGNGSQGCQNKFGAVRTVAPASWGGTRLADSKAGAQLARTLDTLRTVGAIVDWVEEVSIPIGVDEAGKVIRYRADALVLLGYVDAPDSPEPALVVRLVDAKRGAMDTPTSKAKRAALRNRGWNVEVRS